MKRLQFCLVVFAVLALAFSAFAQVENGQFSGTVTDQTGAAIANAKVTVTNPATNSTVSVTTNSSGNYIARELPVGSYKLTVEASGFKTMSNTNVVLNAGVIAHLDFKLQIGKATEVVEVTGAAVSVQTDDSKLYTTVGSTVIENTVLSGRDIFDLMQMTAGAVNVAGTDFENGHNTVVNGVREDFNGFL
ncbi:MAG TPA: carboxypeptidase-like regulatory domain-containing protein, partial [Terriglobales bacterium]|nr:carboxypeptidase-like regulatory domain-containing protein [Terriglobales bacterium]